MCSFVLVSSGNDGGIIISQAREYAARVPKPKTRARPATDVAPVRLTLFLVFVCWSLIGTLLQGGQPGASARDYLSELEQQHLDQQRAVAAIAAEAARY